MNKQLIIPILTGITAGAAFFFIPFLVVRILVIVLILAGIYRLYRIKRHPGEVVFGLHPAFADSIRRMSEADYQSFRQSLESPFRPYGNAGEPTKTNEEP